MTLPRDHYLICRSTHDSDNTTRNEGRIFAEQRDSRGRENSSWSLSRAVKQFPRCLGLSFLFYFFFLSFLFFFFSSPVLHSLRHSSRSSGVIAELAISHGDSGRLKGRQESPRHLSPRISNLISVKFLAGARGDDATRKFSPSLGPREWKVRHRFYPRFLSCRHFSNLREFFFRQIVSGENRPNPEEVVSVNKYFGSIRWKTGIQRGALNEFFYISERLFNEEKYRSWSDCLLVRISLIDLSLSRYPSRVNRTLYFHLKSIINFVESITFAIGSPLRGGLPRSPNLANSDSVSLRGVAIALPFSP